MTPRSPGAPAPLRGVEARRALLASLGEALPAPLRVLAARDGRVRRLAAGERLFAAGDAVEGLHLVVAGAVRVLRETTGRRVVVHHEGPGGLLGEVALFAGTPYPGTAVALEPTAVLAIPAASLRRALRAEPALAELLLQRLARRAREVIERLDRVATRTVGARLAAHLHARTVVARRRADAPLVTLGMTQVQLAEELGTVKEVVTREVRRLVRAGVLEAAGQGRYVVRDAATLARLADAAP